MNPSNVPLKDLSNFHYVDKNFNIIIQNAENVVFHSVVDNCGLKEIRSKFYCWIPLRGNNNNKRPKQKETKQH